MNRLPIQMNNVNLACDSIFLIHKRQPEVNQAVTYPKSLRFVCIQKVFHRGSNTVDLLQVDLDLIIDFRKFLTLQEITSLKIPSF
jgi:hypothetical protein